MLLAYARKVALRVDEVIANLSTEDLRVLHGLLTRLVVSCVSKSHFYTK